MFLNMCVIFLTEFLDISKMICGKFTCKSAKLERVSSDFSGIFNQNPDLSCVLF